MTMLRMSYSLLYCCCYSFSDDQVANALDSTLYITSTESRQISNIDI